MRILPLDLFEQQTPAMIDLLREMVLIESPSTDKAAVDRLGAWLIPMLATLGGKIEVFPQVQTGNHIVCRWGSGGVGGILLLAHMDTVFDLGTLIYQPFRQTEDELFGPGVLDMKGSIAMLLSIFQLFNTLNAWPDRPVTALFTSDEEIGSGSSRELIEAEARKAEMVFCLEPALSSGAVKTARKGIGEIKLYVQGTAAHAGVDHAKGRNAIEELAHHVLAAQKLTDYARGTTVNVGVISGGTRSNVVPERAEAEIDFRISTTEEYQRLERWTRSLQPVVEGTTISATIHLNRPPMPRDEIRLQTFQKAQGIAGQLGLEMSEGSTGGGSDANFVAPLGIPLLDGLGLVGDGAHSEREFAWIKSLPERAAVLANLIINW